MTNDNNIRPIRGQVFVAYAYGLYPKDDYRKIYAEIEAEYPVRFIFADEKITNMHIMAKIESYIKGADFSIFDISGWNPNVTLELGFAMARARTGTSRLIQSTLTLMMCQVTSKASTEIQYSSLTEYAGKLLALMDQRYSKVEKRAPIADHLDSMQTDVLTLLARSPGLKIAEIAEILNVDVKLAQVVVAPLVGERLETTGNRKGTKYFLSAA